MSVRLRYVASLLILNVVGLTQVSYPATKKPVAKMSSTKSTAVKPTAPSNVYSQIAFDGTVSAGFQGNNLTAILDDLFRLYDKGKGEYETTEQYEARLKLAGSVLHGGISRGATLAFVLPTDEMAKHFITPLRLNYDADKGAFTVQLQVMPVNDMKERAAELEAEIKSTEAEIRTGIYKSTPPQRKESENVEIEWGETEHDSHDYVGSNAFGAKVDVHSSDMDEDVIEMLMSPPGDHLYLPKIEFQVPVDVSQAQLLKDRLRALLICTLRGGNPIRSTSTYHEATISEPTELLVMKRHLKVNATEVWIFDGMTGKVYAKIGGLFYTPPSDFTHEVKLPTSN